MTESCSVQVDYVEPSQNTISLKMIPRIDLDRIKAKMSLVGRQTEGAEGPPRWWLVYTCESFSRKTGSPRGRSSRGPVRGCSMQRRSGTATSTSLWTLHLWEST